MKAKASVKIKIPFQEYLPPLLRALKPEIKKTSNRAKVTIETDQSTIILTVVSKDTIALRATLNTYLRWISSTLDALDVIKKENFQNNLTN
jgi:KEOPS complex subunit Pcc1